MDTLYNTRSADEEPTNLPPKKKLKIKVQNFALSGPDQDDGTSSSIKSSSDELGLSPTPNWYSPTHETPPDRPSFGGSAFSGFSQTSESPSAETTSPTSSTFSAAAHNMMGMMGFKTESDDGSSGVGMGSTDTAPGNTPAAPASASSNYSAFSQKMMARMGYKEGEGLGKDSTGRTEIIEASKQRGRRGLGLKTEGFEANDDLVWEGQVEQKTSHETKDWIPPCKNPAPQQDELMAWREWKKEKRKDWIEDETHFCDDRLLASLLKHKTVFDNLEGEEMRQARTRSNPYETIRGAIFLNRAAMKMANMDHVYDYMFTKPTDKEGRPMLGPHQLLYFADICAGPGGFSEYVLWRKKCHAKGIGFTLKGPCDFKLEEFYAASPEFFEPFYGVGGIHGDGDAMNSDNQREFRKFVMETTNNEGVHFVMADGGFSVAGRENIQEILSKQLTLCQFLCAISVIRTGGSFVCKVFDLFTPFSIGLVYLMYRAFHYVSIFKPVTSRPANSERYVVCKNLRPDIEGIHDFMFDLNVQLNNLKDAGDTHDILHAVPMEVILADAEFTQYMTEQNNSQAKTQSEALAKIQAYVRNPNLFEPMQAQLREDCLKLWEVPGTSRTQPKIPDPMTKFKQLSKEEASTIANNDYFHLKATPLEKDSFAQKIRSVYDYRCLVSGGERSFVLGLGRSHVYHWDGKTNTKWRKLEGCTVKLPGDTLFEAEMLQELRGEGAGQRRIQALHIIDAMWLGGTDVRNLHFTERMQKIKLFVKAIHKPSLTNLTPFRVKDVFRCEEMATIFNKIEPRRVKGQGQRLRLCFQTLDEKNEERWFLPTGLYFVKTVKDPWTMHVSKSQKRKYFYNCATRESVFEFPPGCAASFKDCRGNRLQWMWDEGVKIHESQDDHDTDKLSKDEMLMHIHRHL